MTYADGLVASLLARSRAERARAVHTIASTGLVVTWIAGYLLAAQLGVARTELWIAGALLLSFCSQIARVVGAAREKVSPFIAVASVLTLLVVLVLMVFRLTWAWART